MGKELKLQHATVQDSGFLFELRNDEIVRKNSFSTERIPYEDHCAWLLHKLQDSNCSIWIVQVEDERIGQIRVDRNDGWGEISYSLCAAARGRKFAKQMIQKAEQIEKDKDNLVGLLACVKKDNEISRHIFTSLKYNEQEKDEWYEFRKKI